MKTDSVAAGGVELESAIRNQPLLALVEAVRIIAVEGAAVACAVVEGFQVQPAVKL